MKKGHPQMILTETKPFPIDNPEPLYAAPQPRQWVGLTPQEVTALIMEGAAGGGWQGFAQRLSDKLMEKNA